MNVYRERKLNLLEGFNRQYQVNVATAREEHVAERLTDTEGRQQQQSYYKLMVDIFSSKELADDPGASEMQARHMSEAMLYQADRKRALQASSAQPVLQFHPSPAAAPPPPPFIPPPHYDPYVPPQYAAPPHPRYRVQDFRPPRALTPSVDQAPTPEHEQTFTNL